MASRLGVFVTLAICIAAASAEWKDELLNKENGHRSDHGVEPLKLNSELSAMAQKHADKLAMGCARGHASEEERAFMGDVAGENIHYRAHSPISFKTAESDAHKAADSWYSEIQYYPWPEYKDQDLNGKAIGHFTQQVWKGSQQVGYGLSYGKMKGCPKIYVVANYFPGGNMEGDYGSNVLPKQ